MILALVSIFVLWTESSQQTLSWTAPFPSGYQLLPGDVIKVPLEPFLNTVGTGFRTRDATTTQMQISSRIALTKSILANQPEVTNCNYSVNATHYGYSSNHLIYLLCDNKYLVKIWLNPTTLDPVALPQIARLESLVSELDFNKQVCTDLVHKYNYYGRVYVVCHDPTKTSQNVVIYETSDPNGIYPAVLNRMICPQNGYLTGDIKFIMLPNYSSYFYHTFYSASIPTDPTSTAGLKLMNCRSNNYYWYNYASQTGYVETGNLAVSSMDANLYGVIIGAYFNAPNGYTLFLIGQKNSTSKHIALSLININTYGSFSTQQALTTYWNFTSVAGFDPYKAKTTIWASKPSLVSVFDRTSMYNSIVLFNTATTPYYATVTELNNSTSSLDCGASGLPSTEESWPYRIFTWGNTYSEAGIRILIEYRTLAPVPIFKEFAYFEWPNNLYCSRLSNIYDSQAQNAMIGGLLNNKPFAWTVKNNAVNVYTFMATTFLTHTAESTPGTYSIPVTAYIPGRTDSPTAMFTYTVLSSTTSVSSFFLPLKTYRLYPNTTLLLPLSSLNFQSSAISSLTSTVPIANVNFYYSTIYPITNFVNLDAVAFSDGITRVLAVNNSAFIVISRKVGQDYWWFAQTQWTTDPTTGTQKLEIVPTATPSVQATSTYGVGTFLIDISFSAFDLK